HLPASLGAGNTGGLILRPGRCHTTRRVRPCRGKCRGDGSGRVPAGGERAGMGGGERALSSVYDTTLRRRSNSNAVSRDLWSLDDGCAGNGVDGIRQALNAPFLVCMHDGFRVRARAEHVAACAQLFAQRLEIVDLAVVDDPYRSVGIAEGIMWK